MHSIEGVQIEYKGIGNLLDKIKKKIKLKKKQ